MLDNGDFEMPIVSVPEELKDVSERKRDEKERLRQEENQKNLNVVFNPNSATVFGHKSVAFKSSPVLALPKDIDSQLSEKMVILKNWAIGAIRGEVKPKILRTNSFVAKAAQVQDIMPLAQFTKNIKPEIEKGRVFLPLVPVNPHRSPPENGDKLVILKILVQTVIEDIIYMLDVFSKLLQETRDNNLIIGIVGFVKEVKREISYISFQ